MLFFNVMLVSFPADANLYNGSPIIVGDDIDYPPYSFLDENGNPAGFNIELAEAVLEVMGLTPEFTKQLNDKGYISFLEDTLKREKIEATYIDIEITESIFLEKKDETIAFLDELKTIGVKIVLDDFGTGYSSLSYLTFLPVDKIKLDKSLNDKFLILENIGVMDSLISLAHSLNLQVVAEGIEEVEQYKRLKVGKCDYIQGYLFSKPLEASEIEGIFNYNFLERITSS